mmetsp:Transcript_33175/g.38107  ORF Transcript_33175/g.38107 Transcript_33175/m.38107 type:complete len:87 (+) Transcript_33175:2-262(+)|eukprot:CAMPEP_0168342908 /NCGR_PEP_ID=MMETSP0213-20121227/15709_1 /TAXON_ID=151035 /ORGANISM="Euplotes harpa, Strain FSP1.4" /LENGTH=86 /DNA_ID=CAMNT_0008349965 /DNA_START=1 /DNA_END=261 /DNA_ORIENTATION=+
MKAAEEPKTDEANAEHEGDQEDANQEPNQDNLELDPKGGYDDPEEGEKAEKIALCSHNRFNLSALPNQDYLEIKVMPTVIKALAEV